MEQHAATGAQTSFNFYWETDKPKTYWIWKLQKLNLLENNPNNTRNNMKSHIKNKKDGRKYYSVELLISTLNKIIRYQFLLILLELWTIVTK